MTNAYKGEKDIELNGQSYTLVYNWRAIAKARSSIGVDNIAKFNSLQEVEPEILAEMVAIGLEARHPEQANKDFVLDASPVVAEAIKAIDEALSYAYFGADYVEARRKAEAEKEQTSEDFKKKTL